MKIKQFQCIPIILLASCLLTGAARTQGKKALSVQDIMQFKEIHHTVLSSDGTWAAYTARPDRGDGEVIFRNTKTNVSYAIEQAERPRFSEQANWAAATVLPPFEKSLSSGKDEKLENGMALLNTLSGDIAAFENVESWSFSMDGNWLAYKKYKSENTEDKNNEDKPARKNIGTDLRLFKFGAPDTLELSFVQHFAFDSTSAYMAFTVSDTSGDGNGLYTVELKSRTLNIDTLIQYKDRNFSHLEWDHKRRRLAFLASEPDEKENMKNTSVYLWDNKSVSEIVPYNQYDSEWIVYEKNRLTWSYDGRRLFFGLKPQFEIPQDKKEASADSACIYDIDKILKDRGVDVWHWNDPFINTHQKKIWPRVKDQTYLAVYHLREKKTVRLADPELPRVMIPENANTALAYSDVPYRKMMTWYGSLNDLYLVDMRDGSRKLLAEKLEGSAHLSPEGKYVVYYNDNHWHLYDLAAGLSQNLTESIDSPFYNEDHDYPQPAPGYGIAGWMKKDQAVLIYDKYDIWQFDTKTGKALNLTEGHGRNTDRIFRIEKLNPGQSSFSRGEALLLSAYHDMEKTKGFYAASAGRTGVDKLVEEECTYTFLRKAENGPEVLYTRESYTEFPDLWISDLSFAEVKKLSEVNPQIEAFAWGEAELVTWNSVDGTPLQGILIKPGNYEPGKQYPVLVYYYRFFSQRLHNFNQMVINHRPNFPFYASNGYAVFLPDIRFDIGLPGYSATKCLVPGVQKLIDMGIADPNAVALHGHSWSGYQTAFVITQTNLFRCAIAGAPVSNMTSAYSGIRWGTGMARQFQYEQAQSRIGGSLWEKRDLYIENSPVFFADRIQTPLLIMFGDVDEAVPWEQGIELYMAMRRLEKDCVFLQYRGEPHHPQKYANKLDYTLKMKEYLDHYLKGVPAPEWISEGMLYNGK